MTIKYALIVAFVLTALACGQEPAASPRRMSGLQRLLHFQPPIPWPTVPHPSR